jgi:hypothetical protein
MKAILIFLILISSFTSFSQSDNVIAITLKLETIDNNLLDYKLTLEIVHLTSTIIQILKMEYRLKK